MKQQNNYFDWSIIFDQKEERDWSLEKYRKQNQYYCYSELEKLWKYVADNAGALNYRVEKLEDYEIKELLELRLIYPELEGINDSSLSELYFSYQRSFNAVSGYDIYREEEFIFYLILTMAEIDIEQPEDMLFIGEVVAFFLLQNKELCEAKELAIKIGKIHGSQ